MLRKTTSSSVLLTAATIVLIAAAPGLASETSSGVGSTATYGFSTLTRLNPNSSLSSMIYVSGLKRGTSVGVMVPQKESFQQIKQSNNLMVQQGQFEVGKLTFTAGYQDVGDKFTGFTALQRSGAAPPDVLAQLEKEKGLKRLDFGAAYDLGQGMSLSASSKSISDDKGAGLIKQSIGLSNSKMNIKIGFQDVNANFDRLGDLSDPDKQQMAQDKGFKRTDLSGTFKISPRLSLGSSFYSAKNSAQGLSRSQFSNNVAYTASSGAKFSFFTDNFTSGSGDGKSSGYSHQRFTIENKLNMLGGISFSGLRDTNTTKNADGTDTTANMTQMHIESDRQKRNWLMAERKESDFGNGKFENTQSLSVASKPFKNLNLTGALQTIDRDSGSESTNAYNAQWGINKRWKFTADVMDKTGVKTGVTGKSNYDLSGILVDRIGSLRNVKISLNRTSEEQNGKLFKELSAVKMESGLMGGNLTANYSSGTDAEQNPTSSRGIGFTSDRSDKKLLKFGVTYKVCDPGQGDPVAVKDYSVDCKINDKTNLNLSRFANREQPDGRIEPVGGDSVSLSTRMGRLSYSASLKKELNYMNKTETSSYGLSIAGKLSDGAIIEVGFLANSTLCPGNRTKGDSFHIKYDRKVSDDNYISLTTDYKIIDDLAPGKKKDLQTRLDFHKVFH